MTIVYVLGLACLAFCLWPLRRYKEADLIMLDYLEDKGAMLKMSKANAVLIIKELDFDYETGKLSKEDYKHLRDKYEQEAVRIMQNMDEYDAEYKSIEARVKARLGTNEVGGHV